MSRAMDALLETAPCGFLSVGDDGVIALANSTLAEMLGTRREALVARHVDSIMSPASRIFYQTHVFPLLKLQGAVHEVYVSLRDAEGREHAVLLNARRRADARPAASDWVVVPMRQRNELENEILKARKVAEEAARAKDEFLAVVSHELRSPLSAITGWAHLLLEGRLDAATRTRALQAIQQNALLQVKLVDDLLDFGRITTGKLRLEMAPMRLDGVLSAAVDGVLPSMEAKSIAVELDKGPAECLVLADANRLRQVFWNILTNAMKFTPPGGRVWVRSLERDAVAEVRISDNGKGIAPEFLPFLFERFRQEDAAGRRESGLGLGMAITRHLVELHGGTISAASDGLGKGATFVIRLPLLAERAPA